MMPIPVASGPHVYSAQPPVTAHSSGQPLHALPRVPRDKPPPRVQPEDVMPRDPMPTSMDRSRLMERDRHVQSAPTCEMAVSRIDAVHRVDRCAADSIVRSQVERRETPGSGYSPTRTARLREEQTPASRLGIRSHRQGTVDRPEASRRRRASIRAREPPLRPRCTYLPGGMTCSQHQTV